MLDPWSPQLLSHWWPGASGRLCCFWIYPLSPIPTWIGPCNYIFARPRHYLADQRQPFYIGEKGDTDRFEHHDKLWPALALGATELHVCFAARSRWERLGIETDLRNAHWTPLNVQPTRALTPANALCGIAPHGIQAAGGAFGIPPSDLAPSHGGGKAGIASALQPRNALLDAIEPPNSLSNLLARLPGTRR